jgi:hypothetical protein
MPVFLGFASTLWFLAGGLLVLNSALFRPANVVEHQQLTGQVIVAVMLLSFGVLFAFTAWVAAIIDEQRAERAPPPAPADQSGEVRWDAQSRSWVSAGS